jgi:hypothetical protein
VHADVAARQREGVDAAVAHQERLEGEALVEVGPDLPALARGWPSTVQASASLAWPLTQVCSSSAARFQPSSLPLRASAMRPPISTTGRDGSAA